MKQLTIDCSGYFNRWLVTTNLFNFDACDENLSRYIHKCTFRDRSIKAMSRRPANSFGDLNLRLAMMNPLGFDAGDGNLYRYVRNKSTRVTDPSGLDAKDEFLYRPVEAPSFGKEARVSYK